MRSLLIVTTCLLLAGCASMGGAQRAATTADTFCLQKRRTWSVNDTPETVRDAEVFNDTLGRRCGGRRRS